jgi:hypothetical protein
MAPYPRESNSSGATGALIATVVIGVLILGALAMIGLGFLFYFSVQQQSPQLTGVVLGEAGVGEPMPSGAQPAEEASAEQSADQPSEALDIGSDPPLLPDAQEALAPGLPEDFESVEASDPVAPPPADLPGKKLAELTPLEVLDIRLGDLDLVRLAKVAGEHHRWSIWAQPSADRGTCQISYPLQQAYQRLTGAAAVADASEEGAEIPAGAFRIYGDGNLLWDSGTLAGYGVSKPLDVGVQGIRQVVLVAESDSPSEVSLFAWVDMHLVSEPSRVSP